MLKFKRKLLAAMLAVSIMLSSGVVWSQTADTSAPEQTAAPDAEPPAAEGDAASGEGDASQAPITEGAALDQMKEVAKTDSLTLYLNEETMIYAVKNNKSGYVWWSTPYDFESDPVAKSVQKNTMASIVTYRAINAQDNKVVNPDPNSYDASVKKGNCKVSYIDGGVKFTLKFNTQSFIIPVSVRIEGDRLITRVHTDEIEEHFKGAPSKAKYYELVSINLAQSFGAARDENKQFKIAAEEGYIFVPDGSGAIINFNNGKSSTQQYSSKVYGLDSAVSRNKAASKTEQVYLPILGMVKNVNGGKEGMLAVVTEGDAYASVNAAVSHQLTTNYNSAWFSFDLRATDTYTIGTKEPLTVFQAGEAKRISGFEVSYFFLSDNDLTVTDLANTYRDYLIENKGLKKQSTADSNALSISTVGGTITKKSVLGFPVDTQTPATAYAEAEEILTRLKALGVDSTQLIYNDFTDSSIKGRVSSGAAYSGKLGGKSAFDKLCQYVKQNKDQIYPGINFMEYTKSGNGYSFTLNASKRITKAYATQNDFDLAFGEVPSIQVRPAWSMLSPYYWPDVFQKICNSFKNEGLSTITLQQATKLLYSDFSRYNADGKAYFLRDDSIKILTDGYKKLSDAGISILAQECNAYALPFVKAITNLPLYSSNYDLFDYDVPFYQILIHGYIPYSSKPVNASSNANELRLLSMLTGSGISYMFMYNSPELFIDTKYDKHFYANYEGWLEIAANDYKMYNELVGNLHDKTIVNYTHESDYVYSTEYSDGTIIKIDVDKETVSVNGKVKLLEDYVLKGDKS